METSDDAARLVEDGLDRVPDGAKFLGISVAHLYALMERHEIPYVKFGKSRRIPRRALIEFAMKNLING